MLRLRIFGIFAAMVVSGCALLQNDGGGDYALKPASSTIEPMKTIEEVLMMRPIQVALNRYEDSHGHKALAISESGIYHIASNTNSQSFAKWEALRNCREQLNRLVIKGVKRDCFLYALNDEIFEELTNLFATASQRMPRPEVFDITLGDEGSKAYAQHLKLAGNKAFAVSPGGGWAHAYDFGHPDDAAERAVRLCNVAVGLFTYDEQCQLYSLNGQVLLN